jgi:hypothetical protein
MKTFLIFILLNQWISADMSGCSNGCINHRIIILTSKIKKLEKKLLDQEYYIKNLEKKNREIIRIVRKTNPNYEKELKCFNQELMKEKAISKFKIELSDK